MDRDKEGCITAVAGAKHVSGRPAGASITVSVFKKGTSDSGCKTGLTGFDCRKIFDALKKKRHKVTVAIMSGSGASQNNCPLLLNG